jgi:hypothetical protein
MAMKRGQLFQNEPVCVPPVDRLRFENEIFPDGVYEADL